VAAAEAQKSADLAAVPPPAPASSAAAMAAAAQTPETLHLVRFTPVVEVEVQQETVG